MFPMKTVGVVAPTLFVSAAAMALPQDAFWVEVPVIDDAGDSSDLTGFRSFDLFVTLETGDLVYVHDFGVTGPNVGISLGAGQDFFQHEFGTDTESNPLVAGMFPDLEYDTRGQMGTLDWDEYSVGAGIIDWDPAGVTGGAFVVGLPEPGESMPDENNHYWCARITVNSAGAFGEPTANLGEYLGGQIFLSGEGPNGEFGMTIAASGVVDIPNAFEVPAPGAAVFGALGGCALLRRRR